eukprot:3991251-Prymnesium_polylepis.1
MAARDARPTDAVTVECVGDGAKLRVRVAAPSDVYCTEKNVQFPRELRAAGKRFRVETLLDAGSFYRARGKIVEL